MARMKILDEVRNMYLNYVNADRTLSHNETYKKKGGLFGSLIRGIKDTTLEEEFTKVLKKELQEYKKDLASQKAGYSNEDDQKLVDHSPDLQNMNPQNSEQGNPERQNQKSTPSALTQLPSLLSFIYTAQDQLIRDERTYYMLISLHSLTKDLIPYLSAEEAKQLRAEYTAEKKKEFAALPACQEILKLLEKQAKSGISS